MWSIEYIQVPVEKKGSQDKSDGNNEQTAPVVESHEHTGSNSEVLPRNRRESCDSYGDINTVVNKLKEFKEPDLTREIELGSSVDSDSHIPQHLRTNDTRHEDSSFKCNNDREENIMGESDNVFGPDGSTDSQSIQSNDLDTNDIMHQSNISETQTPSLSEPCIASLAVDNINYSQSHNDLKSEEKGGNSSPSKSNSSEFEVINDNEVKNAPKTVDDLLNKYKPKKKKNALREGTFNLSPLQTSLVQSKTID